MQDLCEWAKRDGSIHAAALPIFRDGIENESEVLPATAAARGIGLIAGPAEGRLAVLKLANHPRATLAGQAVLLMKDPSYVPDLLDLLQRRSELEIQSAVVYMLGRSKNPVAFSPIVQRLAIPELRVRAIEALSELGDARAIPHLEGVLDDRTDAWEPDGHVATLRVCGVAETAIQRLRPKPIQVARAPAAPLAERARNFMPYIPLAAATAGVPWVLMILAFEVLRPKATGGDDHTVVRILDFVAIIPAALGLLAAAVALRQHWRLSPLELICLVVGCLGCTVYLATFGREFLN